jgi:hypothetical protein
MAGKKESGAEKRKRESRHFLIDLGYAEGEEFCKHLINTGDFSGATLAKLAPKHLRGQKKESLAAGLAPLLLMDEEGAVDADAFVLSYCTQPRSWLALRRGSKKPGWPTKGSARDFLSRKRKGTDIHWYGPFGSEPSERWYIAAKNVRTWVGELGQDMTSHFVRWHVIAQVTDDWVALHWNNFSSRSEDPNVGFAQYPYFRKIPEIFDDLAEEIDGTWRPKDPNLANIILHGSFERHGADASLEWKHKRVRSYYNTVALNAHGGGGRGKTIDDDDDDDDVAARAATGLQILTSALARTAATALGRSGDDVAHAAVERALLCQILREWGTKSYEFILERKNAAPADGDGAQVRSKLARMHIYFGTETARVAETASIDSLQHVHCFRQYGGSSDALAFILAEERLAKGLGSSDDPTAFLREALGHAEPEDDYYDYDDGDFDDDPLYDESTDG